MISSVDDTSYENSVISENKFIATFKNNFLEQNSDTLNYLQFCVNTFF